MTPTRDKWTQSGTDYGTTDYTRRNMTIHKAWNGYVIFRNDLNVAVGPACRTLAGAKHAADMIESVWPELVQAGSDDLPSGWELKRRQGAKLFVRVLAHQ